MPATGHAAAGHDVWLGARHRRLLGDLETAFLGPGGVIVVTGDVGVGKTTLTNVLLARLADRALIIRLPSHVRPDPSALFVSIGRGLGVEMPEGTRDAVLAGLRRARLARPDRTPVVIVADEAQSLHPAVLRELGELVRLDPPPGGRLRVLLVGADTVLSTLAEPDVDLEPLVGLRARVPVLDSEETEDFVRHRSKRAGMDPRRLTPEAMRAIAAMSGGIPRVIDTLCDLTYLAAPAAGPLDAGLVRTAAERFGTLSWRPSRPSPAPETVEDAAADVIRRRRRDRRSTRPVGSRRRRASVLAVGLAAAMAMALYAVSPRGGDRTAGPPPGEVPTVDPVPASATASGPHDVRPGHPDAAPQVLELRRELESVRSRRPEAAPQVPELPQRPPSRALSPRPEVSARTLGSEPSTPKPHPGPAPRSTAASEPDPSALIDWVLRQAAQRRSDL